MITSTKYQAVARAIQDKIRDGSYPPGSKLPGHLTLAKQYGVSAITSNRALAELERLGLIERRERSGSYVLESPRSITDIVFIVEGGLSKENLQLMEYWRGVVTRAEQDGISIRTVSASDSKLAEMLNPAESLSKGVIITGNVRETLSTQIQQTRLPCVHLGQEHLGGKYCVMEDRRRAARELVSALLRDGYKRVAYIGNLAAVNHRLARDGYLEAIVDTGIGHRLIRDVDHTTLAPVLSELLSDDLSIDAVLVMGGKLPIAALPILLNHPHPVRLAAMTESSSVLQLRPVAYLGYYSQHETGSLAYEMLLEIASGLHQNAPGGFTRYPPFEILHPKLTS